MKIYNAEIFTMCEDVIKNGYVEIEGGKISKVSKGEPDAISSDDIDANGSKLLPGFIDAHSHIGIIEDGLDFEGDDANEKAEPCTPHLRALDAINPQDYCFGEALRRGITSAVVSPGSANAICGEMAAIKTFGRTADEMLIQSVGIKIALGENPKSVYSDRGESPMTRMSTAALIREMLFKTRRYINEIDNAEDESDLPEYDMKCESLAPLLKGKLRAHFHCHRADDICTAIRIAKEFDLDYVLVHCTEGHIVADILAKEKAKVIIGPTICDRCKPEMRQLRLENAAKLSAEGVSPAICTDHPVIPIQYLPLSALLAVKGGLSYYDAIRTITLNAAKAAGISDKAGAIKAGLDADLQLYDCDPLETLSEPLWVMVNGKIVVDNSSK